MGAAWSAARGIRRRAGQAAAWVCAVALALTACGDSAGVGGRPTGSAGGAGQPACGALNQVCLRAGLDAPLALGSAVELILDFTTSGSTGPAVTLAAADSSVLVIDGNEVAAVAEGMSALLFLGEAGKALDFLHTWVAAPDALRILAYSRNGDLLGRVLDRVTLLVGDEVLVSAEPFKGAQPLLGNFVLERAVEGDAVIVVPDAVGGLYRLVARAPGEATVTLSGLGLEAVWTIEVLP